eukprot:6256214-Prymnesium_polylepis.2
MGDTGTHARPTPDTSRRDARGTRTGRSEVDLCKGPETRRAHEICNMISSTTLCTARGSKRDFCLLDPDLVI